MITLAAKLKVLAFVLVSAFAAWHLAVDYMGMGSSETYRVTVSLPQAGGAFKNGEVTYLGVPVGRVEKITATPSGADLVLRIDQKKMAIPRDVTVQVANRSAIGEQYLDLSEGTLSGAPLRDGDRLEGGDDAVPPRIDELLRSSRDLVKSVPSDALTTVIDETYDLAQGAGPQLARLSQASSAYAATASRNFLVTAALIDNSDRVLSTQLESAESIRNFSRDLNGLSQTLRSSDRDLRSLIGTTPAAAQELGTLFDRVGQPLGIVMSNLVSTAHVFGVNSQGVEDVMMKLPEAISVGYASTGSYGIDLGLAQTYFDPLPCTSGYAGTKVRDGLATSPGTSFNTGAGCALSPSSGTNVRGPNAAPRLSGSVNLRVPTSLGDLLGGSS